MPDKQMTDLATGAAVSDADIFLTRQSGGSEDKQISGAQLKTYMQSDVHVIGAITERTDTGTTLPPTIPGLGIMGALQANWAPAGDVPAVVKAALVSVMELETTNGNLTSISHAVADYAYARARGGGSAALMIVDESRFDNIEATSVTVLDHYRVALGNQAGDANSGTIYAQRGFVFPNLSGPDYTRVQARKAFVCEDPGAVSEFSGGYTTGVNAQTGTAYTLTLTDSGKTVTLDNSSAVTLTVPGSLPAGWACKLVQKGAGAVTVSAGNGATLHNRQSHSGPAGQWAVATLTVISNTDGASAVAVLSGDTS